MGKNLRERQTSLSSFLPLPSSWLENPKLSLWLAASYGILMMMVGLRYHKIGDYGIETDFFWSYVPEAKLILAGHLPIQDFHGPVYQILLALFGLVTTDFFHAGVVLSVISSAMTVFFVYEILQKLHRTDVALVGTLFVAGNLTFVQYTYSAGTDMPFNALATAASYYLLRNDSRSWTDIALSAVLSGVAYLTRYNGVFIVVGVIAIVLAVNVYNLPWKERLRTAGLFLGVFFLTIAPWGFYCLAEKGSFFYNKNYLNIAYEMYAKGRISWDQYWTTALTRFTSLRQVMFSDFGLFSSTVLANVYDHSTGDMARLLGWQTGVFVILGIPALLKQKPGRRVWSYLVLGVCFFGVLLLVFYGERFSMYLLPIYITVGLAALTWKPLERFRFWNRIHIGGIAAVILLFWTMKDSYDFQVSNISSGPVEILTIKQGFDKVGASTGHRKGIVARKPHIAYYLNLDMIGFPYVNTLDELRDQVKASEASYLYFSLMEAGMRPQFQQLLDPRNAPPWLRPMVYTVTPPAVLYKVEMDSAR